MYRESIGKKKRNDAFGFFIPELKVVSGFSFRRVYQSYVISLVHGGFGSVLSNRVSGTGRGPGCLND